MKAIKTVVIVDYNTHKLTELLDTLTETYPVSVVSPQHLSELPLPVSKILTVVMLCMTPDATVLQAIKNLKLYHHNLTFAVLSPKPSMQMITETLTAGATDYFDLADDQYIRFFQWLHQLNSQKKDSSVWKWFLSFLSPQKANNQLAIANNLLPIEPIIASITETFRDKECKSEVITELI